ncbi:hypothetical protein [Nonlabens marinus]|uniref:Uncharacterized protein n=1 Tax=Nonlabens marinus S1-08 TaxID=1454201 RepID=W8VPW5_9FLAO|nr:hypothetical protein [Nonlabens marinus]BAO55309.1 hypothetical protein NMS_1300 [Nonlabens marinus S1-08]
MKFLYFFFTCLVLTSCVSDDDNLIDPELKKVVGFYAIKSFESDQAVDLNGDGITSTDLKSEINDFDYYDLDLRPNIEGQVRLQLVSFIFPATNLRFQNPAYPDGNTNFTSSIFSTIYVFSNDQIILENNSFEVYDYVDSENRITNLRTDDVITVLDNDQLRISISQEYYDYSTAQWLALDIDVVYEKLNFE